MPIPTATAPTQSAPPPAPAVLPQTAPPPAPPAVTPQQAPAVVTDPAQAGALTMSADEIRGFLAQLLTEAGLPAVVKGYNALAAEANAAGGPTSRAGGEAWEKLLAATTLPGTQVKPQTQSIIAGIVRCSALSAYNLSRGYVESTPQVAARFYGETHPVTTAVAAQMKMATVSNVGASGGFTIPDELSSEWIELLRPASVFMQAGPRIIGNPRGLMTIPKMISGHTASYFTETGRPTASTAQWGQERAVSKKIGALTLFSLEWMRRNDAGADQMIVSDLVTSVAQKIDLACLRSDGTGGEPKGLRYWAHADNVIPLAALAGDPGPDAQTVGTEVNKLWQALTGNNIPTTRLTWLWSNRSEAFFNEQRDGLGNRIWAQDLNTGRFKGNPRFWSNQIPSDLGGGSDESEIYYAAMDQLVFAEESAAEISVSNQATLGDGASQVNLFEQDMVAVKVIGFHDLISRHAKAVAVGTEVTWGS